MSLPAASRCLTHHAGEAPTIAHEGYVIQTGRIVMQGAAQALLHDERVKEAYLGM